MSDTSGRYRIQVVSELTKVPSPTLRAWERRYGIPTPARTASAYRLYSDRDVAMVRRMRDLCEGGLSIAEAAKQVKSSESGAVALTGPDADPYAVAVQRLVDAVLAFDVRAVEREAGRALYLGSATSVFEGVFSPALRRVGDLWHEGTLSVAQEHVAVAALSDVVRGMVRLVNPDDASRTVLLACFPEEDHVLPVHGVALRLASWGIATVTLGTRTPPVAISDAVRRLRPSGVGLSVTVPIEPERAPRLVDAFAEACAGVPWFIGGAGVGSVATRVKERGGVAIEGDIADARPLIEALLDGAHGPDPAKSADKPRRHSVHS